MSLSLLLSSWLFVHSDVGRLASEVVGPPLQLNYAASAPHFAPSKHLALNDASIFADVALMLFSL